jgi:AcrR family transcriptional regulator
MTIAQRKRLEPRKKPRQTRSRETVDVILAAAARVFAASGYAATTTNHIARRAGVSIGSLYEYFPSKDAILVALTERHVDEAEQELGALLRALDASPPPLDVLVDRMVRAMVGLHARDPGLHRVLFEQAPLPARLRDRVAGLERAMAGEVARLLTAHGFGAEDAATAARMGVEVLEALTHRLVVHDVGSGGRSALAAAEVQIREISLLVRGYLESKRSAVG